MALLDNDQAVFGRITQTKAEFMITKYLSYDLMGAEGRESSIFANHVANKKIDNVTNFNRTTTLSKITPDTSFIKASILIEEQNEPYTVKIIFQNEGVNSIHGIAVRGTDTLFISTTDKAKKYHALGVELRSNKRVIAGMQLPDMHIGPSFTVVDKSLPTDLSTLAYSILSLVLYINENRN